jgi:hypothetical protein
MRWPEIKRLGLDGLEEVHLDAGHGLAPAWFCSRYVYNLRNEMTPRAASEQIADIAVREAAIGEVLGE